MKKQSRFILFAFLVVLLLTVTAIAASATVREVDTEAELESALSAVENGDEIVVTASMSVSGDIMFSKSATYTVRGSSSDVTVTLTSGSFLINAGNVTFSGGTFIAKSNVLFDIALSKANGDGFTITGGAYIMEAVASGDNGGAILRTRVGVTDEINEGKYADPTKVLYLNDVDIKLSGGMFIDHRATTSQLIDASASNSKVVIGNVVFLSRNVKNYIVDVNNAVGEDIPFANNTVVVQYNGSNYYCYKVYGGNGNTAYAPIMTEGASVALVGNKPGLLFFSTIPSSVVTALAQKSYTFGTLIAPADYVAAAGSFTHANLKTWGEGAGVSPCYVDIPAQNSIIYQQDGSIDFNGGLIYLNSCERAYAAVAYVCVDGTYYYSAYDVTQNARTMALVSQMAYKDCSSVLSEDYPHRSEYMPGAFSPYNTQDQALLREYGNCQPLTVVEGVIPVKTVNFSGTAGTNLQRKAIDFFATYGSGSGTHQILIGGKGATNAAVKQALAKVEGYGYYIGVIGEQIVIAGSNDALTMQALSVFEGICKAANGAAFDLTEIVASNVQMVTLNWETPFVYSHTRDANAYNLLPQFNDGSLKHEDAFSSIKFRYSGTHLYNLEANEYTLVDAPLFVAKQIGDQLATSGYNCIYVPDSFVVSGSAIHIGLTDLARELLLASGKDVGYYGYFIKDGNVVITSYDDATLRLAKSLFLESLDDYALDVNGDGTADVYAIPADFEFENGYNNGFTDAFDSVSDATGTGNVASDVKQLITNYPRPDELALSGAVNVSNGELQLYYLDATVEDYTRYFSKLKQSGYTVYMAEREVEGSYFVTLVNRDANNGNGIMLHIMYNAYKHASTQVFGDDSTTMLSDMFTPTLRVISSKITDSVSYVNHILPQKFLTKQSYTKVTDSKLTVVERPYDGKGCYVYTLEDGSFVIIDGASNKNVSEFYSVLKALYKEVYGTNPSSSNPIRIAAWYLTHGHGDHWGLLSGFSSCLGDDVVLDAIITNFPSNDEIYNAPSVSNTLRNYIGTSNWFTGTSKGASDPVPYYNVHTGQNFFVGNLEFEVMFTPEDMHPWSTTAFNNACTVIRLTTHAHNMQVGGTVSANAVASSKVSLMSLGDIYARSARMMRAAYGSYLESDIMTNGHHGTGGEGELYQLINPQIILWQNKASGVKSKTSSSATDRNTSENLEMIKNTRWRYIISGYRLSSGTYNPTITFGANGVAGLGKATTDEEVRKQAQAFVEGLQNINSSSTISYGTGYYVSYDFFTNKDATAYSGEGYLLWRGNYFSDTTLPEQPEPEPEPEPEQPELPVIDGLDYTIDAFGDEILLPEIN
ncbi:MAG: MBL fold metallo-hydrolase [Clostridia bacterium]|nr:MBL fold metallo-hydrolase [Clostridia bacterium]